MECDLISDSFGIILQYHISGLPQHSGQTLWQGTPGVARCVELDSKSFHSQLWCSGYNKMCGGSLCHWKNERSSLMAAWVQNVQGQSDVRLEASARRVFKQCRMLTAERQLSVKVCWCLEFEKAGNLVPPVKNTEKDWASVLWSIFI